MFQKPSLLIFVQFFFLNSTKFFKSLWFYFSHESFCCIRFSWLPRFFKKNSLSSTSFSLHNYKFIIKFPKFIVKKLTIKKLLFSCCFALLGWTLFSDISSLFQRKTKTKPGIKTHSSVCSTKNSCIAFQRKEMNHGVSTAVLWEIKVGSF